LIFITVGSQKFQFNRLLQEVDNLIEQGDLKSNEVFAQIGYSTYKPRKYLYEKFLDKSKFINCINNSEIIISHGGTGSIVNSLKHGKKVIGVPRRSEYGEHVDNHQYEIVTQFVNLNMILGIEDVKDLKVGLKKVKYTQFQKYYSNTNKILKILEDYLIKNI
jgi:UDP-N-acetylglucosamine transferase subunit ALG13